MAEIGVEQLVVVLEVFAKIILALQLGHLCVCHHAHMGTPVSMESVILYLVDFINSNI
jgi:hypothetical protein